MNARGILGANIKQRRLVLNITREKLAELVDISPNYLGRIERGEVNLTLNIIELIAQNLDTTPYELFAPVDVENIIPPNVKNIRMLKSKITGKIKSKNDNDISQLILLNNLLDYL